MDETNVGGADEAKKVEVKHEGAEENQVEINKEVPATGEQGKDGVDESEEVETEDAEVVPGAAQE